MTRVRLLRLMIGALVGVLWITPLRAQQTTGTVRGRVVDSTAHQPLSGVTVSLGSHRSVTGADGRYLLIGVAAGTDSVRARVIGYAPGVQAVTIAGGDTVTADFALVGQAVNLSEVVVVGYGEQHAGEITSSVTQVSAKDFNQGPTVSPQMLIENKVAGVQVVDNNQPGGGLSIRIRGSSSVNASSEPLYVVDGVVLGAGGGISAGNDPLNFLNPDDIASITVLKDAAASAIYGTNASNGVVLITTKSGLGRPRVEYSGSFSSSSVTRLPSMLSAAQYRAAVLADTTVTLHLKTDTLLGTANTNWFNLIDRTATGQQHNVALTGAGASNSYRLSLGYQNQQGILQGTNVEKISVGVNYNQRLFSDRLDLRANIRGSLENDQFTPGGVLANAAQMGPTQPVFNPASVFGYYNWPGYSLQSANNPVEILNLSADQGTSYRSVGNLQAKYDFSSFEPLQGLTGTVNLAYDVTQTNRASFFPDSIAPQIKSGTLGTYFDNLGILANTQLDMYLDYAPSWSFGPGTFDLTGGYSYSQSNGNYTGLGTQNITSNKIGINGIGPAKTTLVNPANVQDSKLISVFGRASYNINDRYLASVSIRHDGSSRFGPGNQWANFPAASLGWRISQEPFMSSIPTISDLKLRASYGKTGNQSFANYLQFSTFFPCNPQAEVQFGTQFVCPFRPSAVDPNIQWESTDSYDLGLDYGIMNQRISGSIDWYKKNTSHLIFTVPVAAGSNLSNFVTTNIGSMTNNGLELNVIARLLDAGPNNGLSWTADFNAAHNTNQLTSINPNAVSGQQILTGGIAGGVGSTIEVLEPGQPINSFFVCQQVYTSGKPVQNTYVNQAGGANVTGCQTANQRAFHDPSPKWILGFTSSMTYRHFDLSFTLRAWIGNYVYNNIASNLGDYQELERGDPFNLHSSVLQTGFTTPQYFSDYYVENGSFLRLDDITVGYTFPWRAQQLRLFLNVQNAFTITGYSGVDPTAGLGGIDNNLYPRARTVTSGLSVQF